MKLAKLTQKPTLQDVSGATVVAASGYEQRCTTVLRNLDRSNRCVVWGFDEHANLPQRVDNDEVFRKRGATERRFSGNDAATAEREFEALITSAGDRPIIVDISSMTRTWYGSVVRCLRKTPGDRDIRVIFTYAPARYLGRANEYPQNELVGPIPGFSGLGMPDKPAALVMGLGHDPGRATGIREELDPVVVSAFFSSPAINRSVERSVLQANSEVLKRLNQNLVFRYPILDFMSLFFRLEGVCHWLSGNSRVVVAPLGPKLFALAALLVATVRDDVGVWRVSAGARETPHDRPAAGQIVAIDTTWRAEKPVQVESSSIPAV